MLQAGLGGAHDTVNERSTPAANRLLTQLERIPAQRRHDLFKFIDDPDTEVDDDFMNTFDSIVSNLGGKINLKLFELVLKIGLNFTTPDNDSYWFALFVRRHTHNRSSLVNFSY